MTGPVERDPLGPALVGLTDELAHGVQPPPYALIERRHRRRARRQVAGALAAVGVVLGAAVGLAPALGRHVAATGPVTGGRPRVTVTVTVPASPPPSSPSIPARAAGTLWLSDVSFANLREGVALGRRCTSAGSCQLVSLRTTDGGVSFGDEVALPAAQGGAAAKVAAVAGTSFVYAYDPGLLVSTDAGASWRDVGLRHIVDVAAAGNRRVLLLTSTASGASLLSGPAGALTAGDYRPEEAVPASAGSARLQLPADGTRIVTVSGPTGAPFVEVQPPGGSWSRRSMPAACSGPVSPNLASVSAQLWWLVCPSEPGAGGQLKRVFVSTDAGGHWQPVADPPRAGYAGTVTALSRQVAYLSGGRSDLLVTTDGGGHWQPAFAGGGDAEGGAGTGEPHVLAGGCCGGTWVTSGAQVWRLTADGQWRATTVGGGR